MIFIDNFLFLGLPVLEFFHKCIELPLVEY